MVAFFIVVRATKKRLSSFLKEVFLFRKTCFKVKLIPHIALVEFKQVNAGWSNISHDLGLQVIHYFLTNFPNDLHPCFPKPFVIETADFVLKNNTLTFDSNYYLEDQRTAIGTNFSPTYSALTIRYRKQNIYFIIENRFNLNTKEYSMENWWRSLVDCEILFNRKYMHPQKLL